MESCFRVSGDSIYLSIKAIPGSSKTQVGEIKDGRLKVKIAAAPEDGKANEELRSYLAKLLGCPKREVNLTAGEKARLKTLTLPLSVKGKLEDILKSP